MMMHRNHLLDKRTRKSELVAEALAEARKLGLQLTEEDFRDTKKEVLRDALLQKKIVELLRGIQNRRRGEKLAQTDKRYEM